MFTFSCYQRLPLLLDERRREILGHALTAALSSHGWLMSAFVFMPEHVHILCLPWREGASGADKFLHAIKRPSSFRIKRLLEADRDPLLRRLIVLERPDKLCFRFWQEGPGHDRNIRDADEVGRIISYIHTNPVTRGLCEAPQDWPWSSVRQYLGVRLGSRVPCVNRWCWGRGLEVEPWPEPEARPEAV
jgi:putative transposase